MIRSHIVFAASILFLAAAACDNDPGAGKTAATVGAPATPASPQPVAGAVTYTFSNQDSKVEFVGAKVTRKHDGAFGSFRGTVKMVDGDPQKSSVQAEIDAASISADEAKLTGHLKSPDFFDVEQFPKATFVSTAIAPGGKGGASHTVTGNLKMHGVEKSITFPASIQVTGTGVNVKAEFVINRKEFGIVYPGMPDDLIKDEVLIKLDVHAKSGAA